MKGLDGLREAGKSQLSEKIKYFCENATSEEINNLSLYACELRNKYYGARIFFRGLIEFSSYCKNNCFYCGIRRCNQNAVRYRILEEEILETCNKGYNIGFRTFVLQSGEDPYFTKNRLCTLVYKIKSRFPNCAVTLSVGELSYNTYKSLYNAGAERYLLRHETASEMHYQMLHPPELSLINRKECLYNLKEIGYQVGAGFMVDSPYQTYDTLAEDLIFLRKLQPHMIGIGPFIPHKDTRFANYNKPTINKTIILLSLIRIMVPKALIPATTALNTVDSAARDKGFLAGANVIMPNLTPKQYRENYRLYDNKLCSGLEASENLSNLVGEIKKINMIPDLSRGDHIDKIKDDV
ncbi:MAG: [FeFe] hydrogenase H-cluster radical SAM maturase HydE [Bacteroidales bacterium]|jgi:biotin synthase|nr:[FeFe] hydrogenase H-cluster radical SAM maturase HydE [Bacteroidales bacterium]